MKFINLLSFVVLIGLCGLSKSKPTTNHLVFFHSIVPSNLYVNAAQGPVTVKDGKDGSSDIINLLLYPTDKKSREAKTARVVISSNSANGNTSGLLTLRQDNPPIGSTFIAGSIKGLTPGKHGFKIFEFGDMKDGCSGLGNIYDPYNHREALSYRRAIGKVGVIVADNNGKAEIALADPFVSLVGPRSVIGRSIVITKIEDSEPSATTHAQNVGFLTVENDEILQKEACGVIGYAS